MAMAQSFTLSYLLSLQVIGGLNDQAYARRNDINQLVVKIHNYKGLKPGLNECQAFDNHNADFYH